MLVGLRIGMPLVRAAQPVGNVIMLYTFARDPVPAQEFIATGGNPAELIDDIVRAPALLAKDIKSLIVFDRSLLQDAQAAKMTARELQSLKGALNQVEGTWFPYRVMQALGEVGDSTTVVTGMTRKGPRNAVPDLPVGLKYGITDVKDVEALAFDPQMQAMADAALKHKLPFNLITSPKTKSISKPLSDAIKRSGGIIMEFDADTGLWRAVTLNGKKVVR
jgi:hypothetical protein